MDLLLSKILNYECEIFNKYLTQRSKFIKELEQIKINNLDNTQLLNFIDNLKSITDSLKSITSSMEEFNPLENNKINQTQFILFYFLFGSRFFGTGTSDSSELIELVSDPESEPEVSELSEPEL